jgi:site-specific recombinase XerD
MLRAEAYLAHRRDLGYQLTSDETVLKGFARFADARSDQCCLTIALAILWARDSKPDNPFAWARRIEGLRGFSQFCQRLDPSTEIPPSGLFGPAHRRLIPPIFTEIELIALLSATDNLLSRHGLRPALSPSVRLHGKGRKQRTVPLWKETATKIRQGWAYANLKAEQPWVPTRNG